MSKLALTKTDIRLCGVHEIKDILGISRQRVNQLQDTDGKFPLPVAALHCGRIWLVEDIERYAAIRNTQTGRPRK